MKSVLCQILFQALPFLFQDLEPLGLGGLIRRLFIRRFQNFQPAIPGQPLCILRDCLPVKALLDFSNA